MCATQLCTAMKDAVVSSDKQKLVSLITAVADIDLNDPQVVAEPLLLCDVVLQALAQPKAAELDSGSRAAVASYALRLLAATFGRFDEHDDEVTLSEQFTRSAAPRLDQLLGTSDAVAKVQPEGLFQYFVRRMQLMLQCVVRGSSPPPPTLTGLLLMRATEALSLGSFRDSSVSLNLFKRSTLFILADCALNEELLSRLAALDFLRASSSFGNVVESLDGSAHE